MAAGRVEERIARQCGVARGTVRSYIRAAEESGLRLDQGEGALDDDRLADIAARLHPELGRPRGGGWEVCQEHRKFIADKLKQEVRLTKIRKLLRRRQALISYATLRRFAITELGFGEGGSTIPVADGEPGKEVQLDTGWVGWFKPDLIGSRRRFRAWIFKPVVSRYRFAYPVLAETTATAIEACEAAWEFYGGVFDVVIPDNTTTLVQHADPLQPLINLGFLEYSQARGFVIDAARVGKPTDKARVERSVAVVSGDCFGGEEPLDIEDARRHALQWCREEHGMRRHSTTRRLPREHFEADEQPRLHPAPSEPYDVPLWCEPKVHPDPHAQVDYALYSLPRQPSDACKVQPSRGREGGRPMRILFASLAVAALLGPSPVVAGKPSHKAKKGAAQRVAVGFTVAQRGAAEGYFVQKHGKGGCPPGLAKKGNGCLPPGQARKRYTLGQRLPPDTATQPLPRELSVRLGTPPAGYAYVVVDSDIVKLAVGTMLVVDAIEGLGR